MALEQPIPRLPQDTHPTDYESASQDLAPKMATFSTTNSSKTSSTSTPPLGTAISEHSSLPSASLTHLELPDSASSDFSTLMSGGQPDSPPGTPSHQSPDVDPQILEALRSKDRLWVLKLGELMEGLINDRRIHIELSPSTSYQRLLVHRCSAYYKLSPESEQGSKTIMVCNTVESRIPARRIAELVPPEMSAQPAFKIMRRSQNDSRNSKSSSKVGSVAGEDADLSDNDPSETGSLGGRSNTSAAFAKKRMTIEEREAAYNEARSRIFMNFEAKEKAKGLSASSSSASLASSSASRSCGSSSVAGDLDDTNSSPATESEFSAPSYSREKKDRFVHRNASASSSRSIRASGSSFSGNNTRETREESSSQFTFANIYEPTQSQVYDPTQPSPPPQPGYVQPQYGYVYPTPPPANHYYGGYPYYPQYSPYSSPPPMGPPPSNTDSSTPGPVNEYMHPSAYVPPYGWQQPPMQNIQMHQVPAQPSHLPPPHHPHAMSPTAHPQYQQYMPPPPQPYGYPLPYYPPLDTQQQQHAGPPTPYEVPRNVTGGMLQPHHTGNSTSSAMSSNDHMAPTTMMREPGRQPAHVSGKRGGPPPMLNQGRGAWSYGPGLSQGGYTSIPSQINTETIGPRLSTARRQSGNSAGGSSSRSSNDEVSSTASSSTTSSNSRRTYTSTSSSQHPLPPRPDWAVGLKPQGRHHDSRNLSPMPPQRGSNGQQRAQPLPSSTEFPPLSSAPERRTPAASGAWGSAANQRSFRVPGGDNSNVNEESDQTFQRPPPKSSELFNPKLLRRQADQSNGKGQESEKSESVPTEQLERLAIQSFEEPGVCAPEEAPTSTL